MTMIESVRREFAHEAHTTRRLLERLPDDKLSWRPHKKSFTAGALGSHIVDCVRWTPLVFGGDELDLDPATYKPLVATSVAHLLTAFDADVAAGSQALSDATDAALLQPWRLRFRGQMRFEKPRIDVFRDFTLSHMVHHRGQLSVYLRLLDVPVPGAYGPTADERG
jgi:uncharacterized damage-inducible protein DinB